MWITDLEKKDDTEEKLKIQRNKLKKMRRRKIGFLDKIFTKKCFICKNTIESYYYYWFYLGMLEICEYEYRICDLCAEDEYHAFALILAPDIRKQYIEKIKSLAGGDYSKKDFDDNFICGTDRLY
jgi:hypothetical protein